MSRCFEAGAAIQAARLLLFAKIGVFALAASPTITGQWDFSQGDLRATTGSDLQYVGDTAAITSFPLINVNGQAIRVMSFGANSPNQGFYMQHGASPNGGGRFVNQYTLVMDVMYPPGANDQWRALFQTDPFNRIGTDAEFYVGNASTLPVADGIGADGQYDGPIAPGSWNRIVFVVDLTAPAGQQLLKYVNGVRMASQSLSGGIDGRYALAPTAQLFTAGIVGGPYTQPGFVKGIQFLDGPMTPSAVGALGGFVTLSGVPGNPALQINGVTPGPNGMSLSWSGAVGPFQVQTSPDLVSQNWQNAGPVTTNYSITIDQVRPPCFFRVRGLSQSSSFGGGTGAPIVSNAPALSVNPSPVAPPAAQKVVGSNLNGDKVVTTGQTLHAAGSSCLVSGKPVDLVLSPNGSKVYVKNSKYVDVVDVATWTFRQQIAYPITGASMHGIAMSPDGTHVYVTGAQNELYDFAVTNGGLLAFSRTITVPGISDPCGIAISADGNWAYVCLGIADTLGVINLATGVCAYQINVGVAPWDVVLSPDGKTAYVSDWGGRKPVAGDLQGMSAGSPVVVDNRGIGASGVVSIVDLTQNLEVTEVPTGLHPSDLQLSADGSRLYVANANSDTVTVIKTTNSSVAETILIRPDPSLPFGSQADCVALSKDGKNLYVGAAGNNAVAAVELPNSQHTNSVIQGFIPTDWYPGAIVTDSNNVYVANVKGFGSVPGNLQGYLGTVSKISIPISDTLDKFTSQVQQNGNIPQILQTQAAAQPAQAAVPVPAHVGEPSVFQHVVYIIKENKTYDMMLGDISTGNGSSNLCLFPQYVTPNHHALATQYVLLDNYYCNGVLSADGHSWSVEANCTDHIEKSFGAFARSYSLGTDSLTYSSSGFIWNNVLNHGLTFRNYGELCFDILYPGQPTWLQTYTDYTNHAGHVHFVNQLAVAPLVPYTSTNTPGWDLSNNDQIRADGFINELHSAESNGVWETFSVLYLPNDHTAGGTPGYPTPRAMVADNDLALGRVVEAVTKSAFGSNTVIFVIEDDPQSAADHVDGHRSLCLVISPFTRRGKTVSDFYNQAGVVHTMEQIMGLPPMNQNDAMAPLMSGCFTNIPDFTPFTALPSNVSLSEMNPGTLAAMTPQERRWATMSAKLNFSKPDLADEATFNRILWHSVRGNQRYPSEFAGAHGKGLKMLGLRLDPNARKDDDD